MLKPLRLGAITLLICAAVSSVKPARADDWVTIGQNVDGAQFTVDDTDMIARRDGVMSITLALKYSSVRPDGVGMDVVEATVNCRQGTIGFSRLTGYNADGSWIGPHPSSLGQNSIQVTPGSVGEGIYAHVCPHAIHALL